MTQIQNQRKILIIDQNAADRDALSRSLEAREYDVFQTASGQDALSLIKKHHIDIVMMTSTMTDINGVELCRLIREQEKGSYIYIIMLMDKAEETDQFKGFGAEIDAYVTKPPDLEELEALIKAGMRTAGYDHVLMEIDKQEAESIKTAKPENGVKKDGDAHSGLESLKKNIPMGTISRQDQVLAKIAVTNKLITKKQLAEAFTIQHKEKMTGKKLSLDTILFHKQWISKGMLNDLRVAAKRQIGKRFGVIAVNKGYITPDQVNTALKEQAQEFKEKHKCRRLGDILLRRGDISKEQRDEIWIELKNVVLKPSEKKAPQPDIDTESGPLDIDEKALLFRIKVSQDRLEATIQLKKQKLPKGISVDDIKKILALDGVIYGVVDDSMTQAFLEHDAAMQKPLVAAMGKPPVPGKASYLKFYFDRDYLTAGKINEEGEIDYRERGEIPRVKEGELIVEKIPPVEGQNGIDVYNTPIYAPEVEDIALRCEEGTVISEDGLKVYAKIEGQPYATVGGKIFVFSSFDVNGDVDYRTGNIEFDGNINVKGAVKDGFSVKGGSLTAEEILGATIHVKGDVVVKGGILGARIEAEGQVYAKFIKESNIRAYGNVIAEKEVLDSKIRTSGEFIAERGKIISSLVAAKKGVIVKDIGTDVSEPCTIKVGADEHIRKIVQGFDQSRDKVKTALEQAQADHDALTAEQVKVQEETMALVQEQDDMVKKQRVLEDKMKTLRKEDQPETTTQLETALDKAGRLIKSLENGINEKFRQQEDLEERIEDAKERIEEIIDGIEDLSDQKQAVVKWSKKDKANPRITVKGSIYGGTRVSGVHASYILKETAKNVVVEEVKVPDTEDDYEMVIGKPK